MKIYLIGMPGVGKTTFGKKLATCLAYRFIDLDDYIVNRQQQTIAALFQGGEENFRALESAALKELTNLENVVIATGGGVICRADNIDRLRNSGIVIYLKRPLAAIISTLDSTARPLLAADKARIYQLYEARRSLYQTAAHYQLNITDQKLALAWLKEKLKDEDSFD